MSEILFSAQGLKKYYPVKHHKNSFVKAVDNVSFDIREGEILGVVGESGCGKSTLARCVMRLTDLTEGTLSFRGKDITNASRQEMNTLRHDMQMVFQNPYSSFNPRQTIGGSLRSVGKLYHMQSDAIENRIQELLDIIGLDSQALTRHPRELSGGQLQRLAIARALLLKPSFVMADEAVSALDVSVQAQVLNLLMDLRTRFNLTMMFISHELTVVEHVCDRIIVMYLGAVMESGSSEQLFSDTRHPYTMALLSSRPRQTPDEETNRIILQGDVPDALHVPNGCRFCTRCRYCVSGVCDTVQPPMAEVEPGHFVACHFPEKREEN